MQLIKIYFQAASLYQSVFIVTCFFLCAWQNAYQYLLINLRIGFALPSEASAAFLQIFCSDQCSQREGSRCFAPSDGRVAS